MFRATALLTLLSCLSLNAFALPKISRVGRYLYDESGTRFYIKGVAYQPPGIVDHSAGNSFGTPSSFVDPLADAAGCKRDLPVIQELGVNVVRAYSVNSSLNHDDCMNLFSQANIYVILDLELTLNGTFNRAAPSWSTNLLDEYISTIETFSKYDNVLAYNVGNEVIPANQTSLATFVKAAARDVKAFLQSTGSSALVGYGSIDMPSASRVALSDYLSCDPSGTNSPSSAIDLFGLNTYEWCADAPQDKDAGITNDFTNYNVVAYFSEFGCVLPPPRLWTEVQALFGSQMATVFSGGIAFSYFQSVSKDGQYGMVNISSDGTTVTTGDDFDRLKTQYGQVNFINTPPQSQAPSALYPTCPSASQGATIAASSVLPPTPNDAACSCVQQSLSCQFIPKTSNPNSILGVLTDDACQFLGEAGLNCDAISSNGSTGVYGAVAECDPIVKLSYVMSQYFESQGKNAAACSFGGNGTINTAATASASDVANTCKAGSASTVFTPSSVAQPTQVSATPANSATASSGSGSSKSSAINAKGDLNVLLGMGILALVSITNIFWTLV